MQNFTRAGVEKIIIDTTGNGGGSIALSMVWQSFFSPNNLIGDINFSGVMRDTPLARKCLNAHLTGAGDTRSSAAYYGPGNFRSVDGSALTTRTGNYFGNGRNITINGAGLPVSDVCVERISVYIGASTALQLTPRARLNPTPASVTPFRGHTWRLPHSTRPMSSYLVTVSADRLARPSRRSSSAISTSRRLSSTRGRGRRPNSSNSCGSPGFCLDRRLVS